MSKEAKFIPHEGNTMPYEFASRIIKIGEETCFKVDSTCLPQKHIDFWDRFESGDWEPRTIEILQNEIPKNTTFIDLGVWVGDTTFMAAGNPNCAKVISPEPDPIAYSFFLRNLELNPDLKHKIKPSNKAISATTGSMFIVPCQSNYPFGNSSSQVVADPIGNRKSIKVETQSLENLFKENNLTNTSTFIKIDIEGGEEDLLTSLSELVKNNPNKPRILLEIHFFFFKDVGLGTRRLLELFEQYEYCELDEKKFNSPEEIRAYLEKHKTSTVRAFLK